MEQPVVAGEVVLDWDAQFDLGTSVHELDDQMIVVELEPRPEFLYRSVGNHQVGLVLPLLVDRKAGAVDHADFLFPSSEK